MYLCMDVSQRLTRGLYIAQSTATKITYHIVIANRTQDYIMVLSVSVLKMNDNMNYVFSFFFFVFVIDFF